MNNNEFINNENLSNITVQELALEILILAEKIMESQRIKNPDEICSNVEPYPESLIIEANDFEGKILHAKQYGYKDFRDYSCTLMIDGYKNLVISYHVDGTAKVNCKNFKLTNNDKLLKDYITTIYKGMLNL